MLIDASEIFRIGLRTVLAAHHRRVEIVGELERVDMPLIVSASPDVLIVDLGVPGANELVLNGGWKELVPATRLLLSSHQPSRAVWNQVVDAGASGYVAKTQPAAEVLAAFDDVVAGALDAHVERRGPPARRAPKRAAPEPQDGLGCLSRREREVFELLAWGASNKEVATELDISVKTVETHRSHINAKIGAHSAADMVRIASFFGVFDRQKRDAPPPAPSGD